MKPDYNSNNLKDLVGIYKSEGKLFISLFFLVQNLISK